MQKIKRFFKRGNGELLGFAICMPLFIFLIVFAIAIAQLALAKEQLTYVAYACGRAAVIAEDLETGMQNAQDTLQDFITQHNYKDATVVFKIGNVEITKDNASTVTGVEWHKGQQILVTVSYFVDVIQPPGFNFSGVRSNSIVMTIERPAQ